MLSKDKILAKILSNNSSSAVNYIANLHDALMAEYGWIPFAEFKQLPMQTAMNLLDASKLRHKAENKGIPKMKGRRS
jgi:hypothetical protein